MHVSWLLDLIIPTELDMTFNTKSYTSTGGVRFTCRNGDKDEPIMTRIARHFMDSFRSNESHKFVKFLKEVRSLGVKDARKSCLIITVECSSLDTLEELWTEYKEGHLNEMAQQLLVTEDILKEFSLTEVKLTTFIKEDDYRACREFFLGYHGQGKWLAS